MMQQDQTSFNIATRGQGLYEFTEQLMRYVDNSPITTGLLTLFIRHTSASLTIQENADPSVQKDLTAAYDRLAPQDPYLYEHSAEGPDDMPAHIKSSLNNVQLSIPVVDGSLALGTWQGVYLFEHRDHAHKRQVIAHLLGE